MADFLNLTIRILVPVLIFILIGVLFQLFLLIKKGNQLLLDLDSQITPLLEKLNSTADKINDDISRIDTVVNGVEEVSEKVIMTAQLIQQVLGSPLVKVAGISAGVQKAVERLRGKG